MFEESRFADMKYADFLGKNVSIVPVRYPAAVDADRNDGEESRYRTERHFPLDSCTTPLACDDDFLIR